MRGAFIIGMQPAFDDRLPTEELCRKAGQNSGNIVYAYAISSQLDGDPPVLRFRTPAQQLNEAGRIGVIQGANQLGRHFTAGPARARMLERLTARLVILGLGAQSDLEGTVPSLPEGALSWIRRVVERAPGSGPNIGVRGPFTMEVLRHYELGEHAEILGCPSLFINPDPTLGRRIDANLKEPRRIAVVAGHEGWRHLAPIEAALGLLVTDEGGYIAQHGLGMMKLARGEAGDLPETDLESLRAYVCPNMNLAEFVRWSRAHGKVFFNVPDWMDHYKAFDFVIGTRIHGVMVALQAGVPALCIAHDSRTLELCQTMQIPHVLPATIERLTVLRDELRSLFHFDPDVFDANRQHLARRYVRFLDRNGLRPAPWLRALTASG